MLTEISHLNVHRRADGGPKAFKPQNAQHKLEYHPDSESYILTITDKDNPEFRLRTTFTVEELAAASNSAVKPKDESNANGP